MIRGLIQMVHGRLLRNAPGCANIEPQYRPRPVTAAAPSAAPDEAGAGSLPKISVVIPSYNQARFLEAAMLSVLEQEYPKLELMVVDGGSTDGSAQVIERYAERLKWWVSEPDSGQAEAVNKGMRRAGGEILAWLNSDDMLMPGSLFRVARCFVQRPRVDVVYGHRVLIDEQGMDVGRWVVPRHGNFILSYGDFIPQETMFWRRSAWERTGGRVDESFQFALDWDLISRFVAAGAVFYRLPAFLGQFRIHRQQKTSAQIDGVGLEEMTIIRARYLERYRSRWMVRAVEILQVASLTLFMLKAKLLEQFWRRGWVRIA